MSSLNALPSLDFGEAISEAWKKVVQFKGRSRRSEFWWSYLAIDLTCIVVQFIPFIGSILYFALALSIYPLTVRRLHDTGRSGWWCGIGIIGTLIGMSVIFYSYFNALGLSLDMSQEIMYERLTDAAFIEEAMTKSPDSIRYIMISCIAGFAYNLMMIVYMCLDSQPGPNKYGESPKYVAEPSDID